MGVTGTHSDGVPVIAYCVRRASGPVLAERLADEQFYAASTVKLAVLVAVARALEAGTVTLETPLTSADTFRSEAPGAPDFRIEPDDVDEGMPAPGTPMPLADVVERMIVVSSNEATNMVVELLGRDAVNAALADAGATSSSFGRKYSDFAAAAALGGSHRTTAGDLATLMSAVVDRRPRRAGVDLVDDGDARPPARPAAHRPRARRGAVRIEVRVGGRDPPRRRVRR